jgi:inner membrane protein involved in colicin E2 resistance
MEMLTMELIVLLGAVLALLLGAMVVTQVKRERQVRRQTPYGAWR